jgi:5-methyltetrahydrofolate--homocysteine methyltransferase
MRENLEEMSRQGVDVPVLLGGAALTRNYVEDDCVKAYACGRVAYARDAFDGLHLMDKVMGNGFDDYLAALQSKRKGKSKNEKRVLGTADPRGFAPVDVNYAQNRRRRLGKHRSQHLLLRRRAQRPRHLPSARRRLGTGLP